MSIRVRILTPALLISLAVLVPSAGATDRPTGSGGGSAPTSGPLVPQGLGGDATPAGAPIRDSLDGFTGTFGFGAALVGSTPVGTGPSLLAVNPATHTIYVANGNNNNGPNAGGDTVSVIDARDCNANDISRCQGPWPTITVGSRTQDDLPSGIAVDEQTDTVYVGNVGANTVSVFNGATCNANRTSGCGQTPAEVPVGLGPISLYADPANHTIYVADFGGTFSGGGTTVSMIDSAACNATDLTVCPTTPVPTVDVGADPAGVDGDLATHTVYVTTFGAVNGWAVFDANTCNATTQAGCGSIGTLTGDPNGPNDGQVDVANNTLYTANFDNTISAYDLRHCNAGDLAGCAAQTPGTVTPFPWTGFEHDLRVAVDAALHSVYVSYQKDDSLIVLDAGVCNGAHLAACATLHPRSVHTGADPEGVVLDPQTQTLYTANEVDNDVSVIDATRCNAQTTDGCVHHPPAVRLAPGSLAADAAVHTTYIASGSNTVSMIDARNCNADRPSGCSATPPTVTVGDFPNAISTDRRTHTMYVANAGSGATGTVSVLDARACNATESVGCSRVVTLNVPGGNPDDIAVDSATNTVYVATITGSGPDLISVFNGATCNATRTVGCNQAPAALAVGRSGDAPGNSVLDLAVNPATNTIYASNVYNTGSFSPPPFLGDSVFVLNGATCDATNRTGCAQTAATITASPNPGANPWGIALDPATDTIYTANIADGEHPGTVSVINGATCNGQDTSGCGQTPAIVPAGFGAVGIAVDRRTHRVYVTNTEDSSVSVIDGATCNGSDTTGCGRTPRTTVVGDYPGPIAVAATVGTAYVSTVDGVSIIPLTR